jgi:ERCC4-type nuclease
MKLPAEPSPTVIIDSREQNPIDTAPMPSIVGTLPTGDYSIVGLEHVIAIERKSAEDMLACIGRERERFDREIQRLLAYPCRAIVVEAGWQYFERGEFGRSEVKPAAAIGSLLGWIMAGVPVVMAYDHARAGRFISRMLFLAARRRWREARALMSSKTGEKDADSTGNRPSSTPHERANAGQA